MRELLVDAERYYVLLEDAQGELFLRVARGGAFMYEREVKLSSEQLADYHELGKYFLDALALKVCRGSGAGG